MFFFIRPPRTPIVHGLPPAPLFHRTSALPASRPRETGDIRIDKLKLTTGAPRHITPGTFFVVGGPNARFSFSCPCSLGHELSSSQKREPMTPKILF
ncbi:hypothetical protein L210DRAFT_2738068 [Boletus edulis BED1]|uniref:Uncharacterized protein n=1 Tax=Boletus edulis BED1 TaxID=1328754 RepID=A0AAD4BL87_BOLED|nr:hypothetical protein L210DRAFT_2738068 [Boletus edulis BED1]